MEAVGGGQARRREAVGHGGGGFGVRPACVQTGDGEGGVQGGRGDSAGDGFSIVLPHQLGRHDLFILLQILLVPFLVGATQGFQQTRSSL